MRPHPDGHLSADDSPAPAALRHRLELLDAWQAELSATEHARLNMMRQKALAVVTDGGPARLRWSHPRLWLAGATVAGLLLGIGIVQLRPTPETSAAQISAAAQAAEPSALWDIPADELLDEDLELSLELSGLDDAS